jgi:hypothetical protein
VNGKRSDLGSYPCDRCPFRAQYPSTLRLHQGTKACSYRRERAQLYAMGWVPARTHVQILQWSGVEVRTFTPGFVGTVNSHWAPVWSVIVCASIDLNTWTSPHRNRTGARLALQRLLKSRVRQAAVECVARMSGARGVARMLKLKPTRLDHWRDGNPLWWLDSDEADR